MQLIRLVGVFVLGRQLFCGRSGQAMLEYVIVAGMLTASVLILAVFLYTFKEYGGRVLDMVSSEYP